MKKHCVDLDKTGQFSKFFMDYIKGKEELKAFYSHSPTLESFKNAIKSKSFPIANRKVLVEALSNQYKDFEIGPKVESNIKSLELENTYTVTTGHQLNLFTGPLYFIYKIVSTINLAKKLSETYPGNNFIPVYWAP